MKIFVALGMLLVILSARGNSYAEGKVNLSIPHNMNALISIQACKVNSKIKDKKISILEAMLEVEEGKVDNLFNQNKLLMDSYTIKMTEAAEWKSEYMQCTEALIDAKDWPWWKFDLKSVLTGTIIPLIIKFAWL